MKKTPAPLTDLSISNVRTQEVSYFGYEFELPWDDVDEQKSKTTGSIHVNCVSVRKCALVLDVSAKRIL